MMEPFAARVEQAQDPLVGIFVTLPATQIVEIAGLVGYDYVVVDQEHTVIDDAVLEDMARAAQSVGMYTMVRVPDQNPQAIGRVAETGVDAIMFPMVESAAQARVCTAAVHHPPRGSRGQSSLSRSLGFATGKPRPAPVCVIEVETRTGVENIAEILSVPDVDMVFVGPGDLRNSLLPDGGSAEEITAKLKELIDTAVQAVTDHDKVTLGMPATYPLLKWDVEQCRSVGTKIVTIGADVSFLASTLAQARKQFTG
jgi:4-hydroxy-2-oxoheptanedioate aldolase